MEKVNCDTVGKFDSLPVNLLDDTCGLTVLAQLPPGLLNLGNSCYMNSVLQALASSQLFCAYVHENAQAVHDNLASIQEAEHLVIKARRKRQQLQQPNPGASDDTRHEAATALVRSVMGALCRTLLWIQGWEPSLPSVPTSSSPTFTASPHTRALAAGRLLQPLASTLGALQPVYTYAPPTLPPPPSSASLHGHQSTTPAAPAAANGPVDASRLMAALREHTGNGVGELGTQQDAAEALTCLCDALDTELAAWHLMYGRWMYGKNFYNNDIGSCAPPESSPSQSIASGPVPISSPAAEICSLETVSSCGSIIDVAPNVAEGAQPVSEVKEVTEQAPVPDPSGPSECLACSPVSVASEGRGEKDVGGDSNGGEGDEEEVEAVVWRGRANGEEQRLHCKEEEEAGVGGGGGSDMPSLPIVDRRDGGSQLSSEVLWTANADGNMLVAVNAELPRAMGSKEGAMSPKTTEKTEGVAAAAATAIAEVTHISHCGLSSPRDAGLLNGDKHGYGTPSKPKQPVGAIMAVAAENAAVAMWVSGGPHGDSDGDNSSDPLRHMATSPPPLEAAAAVASSPPMRSHAPLASHPVFIPSSPTVSTPRSSCCGRCLTEVNVGGGDGGGDGGFFGGGCIIADSGTDVGVVVTCQPSELDPNEPEPNEGSSTCDTGTDGGRASGAVSESGGGDTASGEEQRASETYMTTFSTTCDGMVAEPPPESESVPPYLDMVIDGEPRQQPQEVAQRVRIDASVAVVAQIVTKTRTPAAKEMEAVRAMEVASAKCGLKIEQEADVAVAPCRTEPAAAAADANGRPSEPYRGTHTALFRTAADTSPLPSPSPLRGLMGTTTMCSCCGNMSTTHVEAFWNLQLPLPPAAVTRTPSPPSRYKGPPLTPLSIFRQRVGCDGAPGTTGPASSVSYSWRDSGGGAAAECGLMLRDCLREAVKDVAVEGVVCARCTLTAALNRTQARLRRLRTPAPLTTTAQCSWASAGGPSAGASTSLTTPEPWAPTAHNTGSVMAPGPAASAVVVTVVPEAGARTLRERQPEERQSAEETVRRLEGLLACRQPLPDLDLGREMKCLASAESEILAAARAVNGGAIMSQTSCTAASSSTAGGAAVQEEATAVMVRTMALRRTRLVSCPSVLALQLLRTVWDPRVGAPVKDGRHVAFPLHLNEQDVLPLMATTAGEALQRSPLTVAEREIREGAGAGQVQEEEDTSPRLTYTLIAVVVHYGVPQSGHYLVYRRVPAAALHTTSGLAAAAAVPSCGGMWLRVSDRSVSVASEQEVLTQAAAVLVYERVSE